MLSFSQTDLLFYSLSQKGEVRMGIGHGAWGIGQTGDMTYLIFLGTAISLFSTPYSQKLVEPD